MAYVNFPSYELAAMTPKDVRQVADRLPHHSAQAFLTAWHEACQHFRHHDNLTPEDEAKELDRALGVTDGRE